MRRSKKARDYARGNCTYEGPNTNSDKNLALQTLSSILNFSGNRSVEMWLRRDGTDLSQVMAVTPDKKFMFNSCLNIASKTMSVEVYSTNQTQPDDFEFMLSNHRTVNLSSIAEFPEWMHVVIQGNHLASGSLQVYVNGQLMPAVAGDPPSGCGWEVGPGSPIILPENLSTLKHLRTYNRLLTSGEIAANAAEGCLSLAPLYLAMLNPALVQWSRFNTPEAGSPGTNDPYSTVETQYLPVYPEHKMLTNYVFNSTGQIFKQSSPDGGTTHFWYDHLSRLVISQNEEQRSEAGMSNSRYSYTEYEKALGRVAEVGEKYDQEADLSYAPGYLTENEADGLILNVAGRQITRTIYDKQPVPGNGVVSGLLLTNLRKRVAASLYLESSTGPILQASYYDYDIMGNVKSLWQQVDGLGVKRIEYDYDLISGKVNLVKYQQEANDRFYYQYKYDAENRVTEAWTGTEWENGMLANGKKDAQYKYYLHGPLARTELGVNVQGMDYAYTLQGWLKGMNSQKLDNSNDPVVQNRDIGRDGAPGGNASFNRDEVGFSLHYFGGDYTPLGGNPSGAFEIGMSNADGSGTGNALYNGNISRMTAAIRKFGNTDFKGYSYRYDQLNRLKSMRADNINVATSPFIWNIGTDNAYREDVTYDGIGNIKTYLRNGANQPGMPLQMDNLTYLYKPGTNQLLQVTDDVNKDNYTEALNQTEDLDGENNYEYDMIGNLIGDRKVINGVQESEIQVRWNVYGKIAGITKHDGVEISYQYNAAGNRIRKSVLKNGQTTDTWYAKDAQGNTIAVYSNKHNDQTGNYWLEQHLFGSSRIGVWNPAIDISNTTGTSVWNQVGKKSLEVSNHLGNVLAVVSDKNIGTGVAEVLSASDYYPFGMLMPGRKFSSSSYRYGFNGKENDNEVKGGKGMQIDFGARVFDSRIGRWLSVDPLQKEYPYISPYTFVANNPIIFIDPDGKRIILSGTQKDKDEFVAKLAKLTGIQLELQKDGNIKMIGNNSDPKSKVLQNIVLSLLDEKGKKYNNNVVFKLVNNEEGFKSKRHGKIDGNSIYLDGFNTGAFDMDDFRAINDEGVYAALLGHVMAERAYIDDYNKSIVEKFENYGDRIRVGRRDYVYDVDPTQYNNAHMAGNVAEAQILSEFFVNESGNPVKLSVPNNVTKETLEKTGKGTYNYGGVSVTINSEGTGEKSKVIKSVEVKIPDSSIKRKGE